MEKVDKKIKTSQNQIKETRRGMNRTVQNELNSEFKIKFDKKYPENHILFGKVKVTAEKIIDGKMNTITIYSRKRVMTSNVKRELHRADVIFKPLLKNGYAPGSILISECKDSGPANIRRDFLVPQ